MYVNATPGNAASRKSFRESMVNVNSNIVAFIEVFVRFVVVVGDGNVVCNLAPVVLIIIINFCIIVIPVSYIL